MPGDSLERSYWDTSHAHIVMERHRALLASPVFRRLRRRWLSMFARRTPFTSIDRWLAFSTPWLDEHEDRRSQLEKDADILAARFAIPTWHVIPSLFISGYRPESGQTPLDLRYPRTSVLISGPASNVFDVLHRSAAGSDVQVVWEPFSASKGTSNGRCCLAGAIDLPVEMPMAEAVRIARRSLRVIRCASKQVEESISEAPHGTPRISTSLVYHGFDPDLLGKIDLAATQEGLPVIQEPGPGPDQGVPHQTPNPLSYLMTRISFSPDVRSAELVRATRAALRAGRQVCRALGVDVGQRVRPAPLVRLTEALGLDGVRLPDRGLGDLVMDQLEGFPGESGRPTDEAKKMMSMVKSRRNQVLDRFRKKGLS